MKFFKKTVLITLSVLCFPFCGSNHQREIDFTQEIVQVYYDFVADDNQPEVIRLNLHMEFKEPLSEELRLQKVYFRNQEAVIQKESNKKYVAHFSQAKVIQDLILDSDSKNEYGNKAPIIVKPKFKLKKDEAILEYKKNNKTIFFKLTGITEK
ncbi:hypothetical protein [Flavobacterium sp. W22_SRS_FP1]|uniref:hypothetical protein n=1 Tax=Flavobacterium sp. W22_SRS_FP1 TaxID=3240276 RepID=UPI003F8FDC54